MKRFNLLIVIAFLFSCKTENKERNHADISKNDTMKLDDNSKVGNVVVGSLREKLKPSDPKVVELLSMSTAKNRNKEVITGKPGETEYFTTYLGKIEVQDKSINVFKQFYTVQAAIEKHGYSEIILLDKSGASYFDMGSYDLPSDLRNGTFRYFKENDTLIMKIEHLSGNDLVLTQ